MNVMDLEELGWDCVSVGAKLVTQSGDLKVKTWQTLNVVTKLQS